MTNKEFHKQIEKELPITAEPRDPKYYQTT